MIKKEIYKERKKKKLHFVATQEKKENVKYINLKLFKMREKM